MTDINQKKENVKMHLKDLRQNLKKMHLEVTEELILPKPGDVKDLRQTLKKMHLEVTEELILPKPDDIQKLMKQMDKLLKLIESK